MTTIASPTSRTSAAAAVAARADAVSHADATPLAWIVPVGRLFLVALFIMSGVTHLSPQIIDIAAKEGIPLAGLAVPLSGFIAAAGGLSVLLGYKARIGAWLLVLFLVPVSLAMHPFWATADPMMAQIHYVMFMKNVGLLGGALLITYFGAGPYSLDAQRTH